MDKKENNINIKGLNFCLTCYACPEQYDVQDMDGNMVGYVRLRHGGLSCEYPDVGGELLYYACPRGDGRFANEEERTHHLNIIADKILQKMNEKSKEEKEEVENDMD